MATVSLNKTYQTMDGFGFSQAFGRASDLYNLPSTQRKYALDLLFNTTSGAGMTILRNRIGSGGEGDSIEPNSPGSPDATPQYASLGSDSNQVWVTQQAVQYGVETIYADAWSAPGFMKTNNDQSNGGYLCGVTGETCDSGNWIQAYVNFLVQYVKDYRDLGLNVTHLGFLNEPDYVTSYSSMQSDGYQAADVIKVLHPALQSAGLEDVGITCCDSMGWDDQKTRTQQLISAGVEDMLSRITSHSYSSDPTSPMGASIPVWETENADLSGAWDTNWYYNGSTGEGLTWANKIYSAIEEGGVSAYLYWEGIEVGTTNSCLITIQGTTVVPSGRLWAFGMWSRFVRPGAVKIDILGSTATVKLMAFKNTDGTVTVQILNMGSSEQPVSVGGFRAASVKGYVMDSDHQEIGDITASISGGVARVNAPAYSMVSLVLRGSA
ncbi:hypothetical protein ATERTT37_004120 [Aspergillus terreus]